jgi:serine/threonine protein kinase/tetratricopeptide (TPR) repeat protein
MTVVAEKHGDATLASKAGGASKDDEGDPPSSGQTVERKVGAVPETIGPYRVRGTLGSGGMGLVYDAVHMDSGQRVAIKTVQDKAERAMFAALRGEVTVLQKVKHPYVVSILDEGLSEAWPWYAMERIEGHTFADLNADLWASMRDQGAVSTTGVVTGAPPDGDHPEYDENPLPSANVGSSGRPVAGGRLADVADWYAKVCDALMHLHAQGIVHRDVKPSNIMLRQDQTPVLMDFGIASRWTTERDQASESLKQSSPFMGTAPYLAPEQGRREFVDSRADLYSLGCAMYETFTGRTPFVAPTPRAILEKHRSEVPVRMSQLVAAVPPELDELLAKLLAKQPRDRIGHADDVARILLRFAVPRRRASSGPPLAPPQPHLYRPTLAGRDDLLGMLRSRLDGANRGRGAALLVRGDSGIGKTFLAAEAARHAELCGVHVAVGECKAAAVEMTRKDGPQAGPLSPFGGLLATFADRFRDESLQAGIGAPADAAAVLAPYEPALRSFASWAPIDLSPLPPEATRLRIFEAIAQVLGVCAPLLLVLDDMQWADELSLAFLEWLPTRFFVNQAILLLGLYRPEEASPLLRSLLAREDFVLLTLDPLPEAALVSMTSDMLAMQRPPDAFMRFVLRRSEGNPFFASEYLRLFTAERLLQRRAGEWVLEKELATNDEAYDSLGLPSSVKAVVARRLRHLGEAERALVDAAAVLGREFDDRALADVMQVGPHALEGTLRALTASNVLDETLTRGHRFVHDHVRQVVYDLLPLERRRALHLATGLALEQAQSALAGTQYAELAHHFRQGRDRAKAGHYREKAAEDALSTFANGEAARFFADLLAEEPSDEQPALRRARWERGLGDALHGMGLLEESQTHLENALRLLGEPVPTAITLRAAATAAQVFLQAANRAAPRRVVALSAEKRLRAQEASQAYDRLLQIFYYRGQQLEMLHATLKTLNLSEQLGPSPELARAYSIAHAVAGVMPVRWLAEAYLEDATTVLREAPSPSVESYLLLLTGVYRSGTAEWDRARAAFDRGLHLATMLGFHRRCEEITLGLANWNFLQGRFGEAGRHSARPMVSSRRDPQAHAWRLLVRAQVLVTQGAVEEAIEPATDAKALVSRLERSELIWTFAVLAIVALRRGELEEARGWADRALEQITSGPPVTFYCIEAYSVVCDVYLSLWEHASRRGSAIRDLPSRSEQACRALRAFERIFPAAAPRRTLHEGTLEHMRGRTRQARTSWRSTGRISAGEDAAAHEP